MTVFGSIKKFSGINLNENKAMFVQAGMEQAVFPIICLPIPDRYIQSYIYKYTAIYNSTHTHRHTMYPTIHLEV